MRERAKELNAEARRGRSGTADGESDVLASWRRRPGRGGKSGDLIGRTATWERVPAEAVARTSGRDAAGPSDSADRETSAAKSSDGRQSAGHVVSRVEVVG